MSRTNESQQIQSLLYSVNPLTAQPYSTNMMEVADGQGTFRWQDIFQTISTQSAIAGSAIGYLPSTFAQIYGAASSISTTLAVSYSTLSTQIGQGGIPGSITGFQLQSTVAWIQGPSKYISTGDLVSSMTPFFNGSLSFMSNIQSTVTGLGSARYVSTATLNSTTTGIGNQLRSTINNLGTTGYISSLSLQSSIDGLGTAGYMSSASLYSSMTGLLYPPTSPGGSLGVVVTGTSAPPYVNFNSLIQGYLVSTNYVNQSNASFYGIVQGTQLPSTVSGVISSLGSLGYVSTATLQSTSAGIIAAKQNIFIDRAGSMSIYNSQVYISSVGAITFLSSFVDSTITYKGVNGPITGLISGNSNLTFSTMNLQFDAFSSLITSSSRITAEIYPTFQFDTFTNGAVASKAIPMETYIQYGNTYLSTSHMTQVAAVNTNAGYSNFYQQPMKISIPGTEVLGMYQNPYVLTHNLPGGLSYLTNTGFRTENVTAYFASTNSYFLTIQNLSF